MGPPTTPDLFTDEENDHLSALFGPAAYIENAAHCERRSERRYTALPPPARNSSNSTTISYILDKNDGNGLDQTQCSTCGELFEKESEFSDLLSHRWVQLDSSDASDECPSCRGVIGMSTTFIVPDRQSTATSQPNNSPDQTSTGKRPNSRRRTRNRHGRGSQSIVSSSGTSQSSDSSQLGHSQYYAGYHDDHSEVTHNPWHENGPYETVPEVGDEMDEENREEEVSF